MEWNQGKERMWIVGHRGVRSLEPENTLRSFQKAIDMDLDGIETDVRETADGHLVLLHDSKVDRTTNGTGKLREMTLAEVRSLDAGKGEKIPLLTEFLDLVRGTDLLLNVEMKDYRSSVLEKTVRLLQEYGLADQSVIACFNSTVTTEAHQRFGMKTQGFLEHHLSHWHPGCERDYYAIGVGMADVTPMTMRLLKQQSIDPWCWCPDTEEQVLQALRSGSTLMTVNDPRSALKIIRGIETESSKS